MAGGRFLQQSLVPGTPFHLPPKTQATSNIRLHHCYKSGSIPLSALEHSAISFHPYVIERCRQHHLVQRLLHTIARHMLTGPNHLLIESNQAPIVPTNPQKLPHNVRCKRAHEKKMRVTFRICIYKEHTSY